MYAWRRQALSRAIEGRWSGARGYRLFRESPFEHAVGQAGRAVSMVGEYSYGVMGEQAVGAAAVCHDVEAGGEFGQPFG
jgi:hypothetical protein